MLAQICSKVSTDDVRVCVCVCVYARVLVYTNALSKGNKGGMKSREGK